MYTHTHTHTHTVRVCYYHNHVPVGTILHNHNTCMAYYLPMCALSCASSAHSLTDNPLHHTTVATTWKTDVNCSQSHPLNLAPNLDITQRWFPTMLNADADLRYSISLVNIHFQKQGR